MNKYRTKEIYISDEVMWYADKLRKSIAEEETGMTVDQYCDNALREKFTTEHPFLVEAWAENQELRGENHRLYLEQEEEILCKLREKK